MALTLTEERKVAWRIDGVGPTPAHVLVVFKKHGTGKSLHKILQPGEVLKLGWRGSSDGYEAYAISKDENLRHIFSRKYQTVSQVREFSLHFTLNFRVSSAEVLALKLEGDDPLKRLEEETARVLGAAARYLPWESIRHERPDFGLRLLDSESMEGSGVKKRNFECLWDFATQLGFDLRTIDVTRGLTERELKGDLAKRDVEIEGEVETARQKLDLERQELEQERARIKERHRQELEWMAAQGNQALQGMERLRMVLDGVAKEGVRVFSHAMQGVHSFSEIKDALLEIQAIKSSLVSLSLGTGSILASRAAEDLVSADEPASEFLLARRSSDPLECLVSEAFEHLRVLNENPVDKRRILATVLHMLAEASLNGEGDASYFKACGEDLRRQLHPLEGGMEEEALDFLRRIMVMENLRKELASSHE